jgi:hypothetical protein
MNTKTIQVEKTGIDVSLDGLFVKETLASEMMHNITGLNKTSRFTQADLWNCRKKGKIRRRAINKIL